MNRLGSIAIGLAAAALAAAPPAAGWRMDMSAELSLWSQPPISIDALAPGALPIGARLDLRLRPGAELKFPVAPRRVPNPGSFGAILPFRVEKDGLYRVCAGTPVWLDVAAAASGANIRQDHFEMQRSGKIRKCVVFPLRAGIGYILQVSGSFAPHAAILITPDR